MKIVAPDFARRIDLPGVGPCPRPVDIDRAGGGLETLVSLRIYSFAAGAVIDGEAEGDDVFIVLMRGTVSVEVRQQGRLVATHALSADHGDRAVYLPPHSAYRLSAHAACDVAYARAEPGRAVSPPAAFAGTDGHLQIPDHAAGMVLAIGRHDAGTSVPLGRSERIVHVRSSGEGRASVGGATISDWQTAIICEGEPASVTVTGGPVELLSVSARA